MADILSQFEYLTAENLSFLAEIPVLYHCHHFNLFLDQTINDAIGEEKGMQLRTQAAHEASYHLLAALSERLGVKLPIERLQLATQVLSCMGHGNIRFMANQDGGQARGEPLHYGFTWKEKYGQQVSRRHSADAFAAGFAAAAVEVAYNLPKGALWGQETACFATGAPSCEFHLVPNPHPPKPRPVVKKADIVRPLPPCNGQFEPQIAAITQGLVDFLRTLNSDQRGLLEGFGVFVTMHLAEYYNRLSYDAALYIEKENPALIQIFEDLLRESGHVCVFNTFGGILRSPEWEGMVGKPGKSPEDTVMSCCAIARALGFGHWAIHAFAPESALILRTPINYEAPYYAKMYHKSERSRCYFFQGAALAFMQLAHRVDWAKDPQFTQDFYNDLFRKGVPWFATETKCVAKGDECCEVLIERKPT